MNTLTAIRLTRRASRPKPPSSAALEGYHARVAKAIDTHPVSVYYRVSMAETSARLQAKAHVKRRLVKNTL